MVLASKLVHRRVYCRSDTNDSHTLISYSWYEWLSAPAENPKLLPDCLVRSSSLLIKRQVTDLSVLKIPAFCQLLCHSRWCFQMMLHIYTLSFYALQTATNAEDKVKGASSGASDHMWTMIRGSLWSWVMELCRTLWCHSEVDLSGRKCHLSFYAVIMYIWVCLIGHTDQRWCGKAHFSRTEQPTPKQMETNTTGRRKRWFGLKCPLNHNSGYQTQGVEEWKNKSFTQCWHWGLTFSIISATQCLGGVGAGLGVNTEVSSLTCYIQDTYPTKSWAAPSNEL